MNKEPLETLDRRLTVIAQDHLLKRLNTIEKAWKNDFHRIDMEMRWMGLASIVTFLVILWHEKDINHCKRRINELSKSVNELYRRSSRTVYLGNNPTIFNPDSST